MSPAENAFDAAADSEAGGKYLCGTLLPDRREAAWEIAIISKRSFQRNQRLDSEKTGRHVQARVLRTAALMRHFGSPIPIPVDGVSRSCSGLASYQVTRTLGGVGGCERPQKGRGPER